MMFDNFLGKSGKRDNSLSGKDLVDFKKNILTVQHAKELLNHGKIAKYYHELCTMLDFSALPEIYHNLPKETITRFAEYVQRLPETQHGYYTEHLGLLEHALNRALRATKQCFHHFFIGSDIGIQIPSDYAVWLYVIFTAALYFRIGFYILKFDITFIDDKKNIEWDPLVGSMVGLATKYQYQFSDKNYSYIGRDTTKILASKLLPEAGFAFITQHKDIYAVWLSLLNENWDEVGSLHSFIPQAQNESILEYFATIAENHPQRIIGTPDQATTNKNEKSFSFLQSNNPNTTDSEPLTGKKLQEAITQFHEWLQKEITTGKITLNEKKSFIQVLKDGALVSFQAFYQFISANPGYGNWQKFLTQFSHIGAAKLNHNNSNYAVFHLSGQAATRQNSFIHLQDANLLLTQKQLSQKSTQAYHNQQTKVAASNSIPPSKTTNHLSLSPKSDH